MFKKRHLAYWVFIILISWSARAADIEARLQVEDQSLLLSEPVTVNVSVSNRGVRPIRIRPLTAAGDDPNVVFYVITDTGKNRVTKPVLVLLQIEGNQVAKPIDIHAEQTISQSFVIGVDWATEKPIFQTGINWLYCVITDAGGQEIESERQRIIIHKPNTQDEVDVSAILGDQDTLGSLYAPEYLSLTQKPEKVVSNIRKIAAFDIRLTGRARHAISLWKKCEKDAREGRAPELKMKGFDRLGLQDGQDDPQ